MILLAILTFFQRIISGFLNKLIYERKLETLFAISVVVSLATFFSLIQYCSSEFQVFLLVFTSLVPLIKSTYVLGTGRYRIKDLHLWELIMTTSYTCLALILGADIITTALVMYPALFIHKALINSAFDKSIFWNVTDDATGKTYDIPSLGIKIPRLTQEIRMVISLACISLLILNFVHWKIHFQLEGLYFYLKSFL